MNRELRTYAVKLGRRRKSVRIASASRTPHSLRDRLFLFVLFSLVSFNPSQILLLSPVTMDCIDLASLGTLNFYTFWTCNSAVCYGQEFYFFQPLLVYLSFFIHQVSKMKKNASQRSLAWFHTDLLWFWCSLRWLLPVCVTASFVNKLFVCARGLISSFELTNKWKNVRTLNNEAQKFFLQKLTKCNFVWTSL